MSELVIFNFTMSADHPLLSHQVDLALELSEHFDSTTVITADRDITPTNKIHVISTNWKKGHSCSNIARLLKISLPVLWRKRKTAVVFSHMTDFQSALLGPFTRIIGVKHFLWYAHKHNSTFLRISNLFVDQIVTSTPGSCPIKSLKVIPIGQAIDIDTFNFERPTSNVDLMSAVHVGRLDPSKNLDTIISAISSLRTQYPSLRFVQIGSPSTESAIHEAEKLNEKWEYALDKGWLEFRPSINRSLLPGELHKFDIFFHAYRGSLDKSLIEATLSGLPVVTINPEYISEFGSWGAGVELTLETEYLSLLDMSPDDFQSEIDRRYRICAERHSRDIWINSLANILIAGKHKNGRRTS